MSGTWPGQAEFVQSLSAIKASKNPLSASKIQSIAQIAFLDLRYYKYVVMVLEKYIERFEQAGQVLSCVFIIDAIVKNSFSLYGANKDRYAVRFEANLTKWLGKTVDLCSLIPEYKDSLLKLLMGWSTKFYFSVSSLRSFIKKLGPNAKQKAILAQLPNTALPPQKKHARQPETERPKKIMKLSPSLYHDENEKNKNDNDDNNDNSNEEFTSNQNQTTNSISKSISATSSSSSSSSASSSAFITSLYPPLTLDTLSPDVLKIVFSYLPTYPDLLNIANVSKTMKLAVQDKYLWGVVCLSPLSPSSLLFSLHSLPSRSLHTILRRSLLLAETNIQHLDLSFCEGLTDSTLLRVVKGCPNLISLKLAGCTKITNKAMAIAAKNLTKIVKINLSMMPQLSKKAIDKIFTHCQSLRNLNLRCSHGTYPYLDQLSKTPTSLQKLTISCHCWQSSIEIGSVLEIIVKMPNLTILQASGVIRGIPAEWDTRLTPTGSLSGLADRLPRGGLSLRTMDPWLAAAVGNVSTMQSLLSEPTTKLEMRSLHFATPLIKAAEKGYKEIVELLVAAGANKQAKDINGNTAIGVASNIEIVKFLLEHGAVPGNKSERDIQNIIQVLAKYPIPSANNLNKLAMHPIRPDHVDTEKLLEFLKDQNTTLHEGNDARKLLGWFLSSKQYILDFINSDISTYRKNLIRKTLGKDSFFTQLMFYIPLEQQKSLLLHLGSL